MRVSCAQRPSTTALTLGSTLQCCKGARSAVVIPFGWGNTNGQQPLKGRPCRLLPAYCLLACERVTGQALEDADRRLARKREHASGHDISVFQRELSGQHGV